MQFLVDQAVLTDSLTGSTMTIATCILGLIALRRTATPLPVYLGAGALIAVAFLIRDVIAFFAIGVVPLAAAAALVEHSRARQLSACALVFLPLIATHFAYTEWSPRSGIGAAIAAVPRRRCSAHWSKRRATMTRYSPARPRSTKSARAMQKIMRTQAESAINPSQASYCTTTGWDAVRINHEVTLAYLRAWRDHPRAMIFHIFHHISRTKVARRRCGRSRQIFDILLWTTGSIPHDYAMSAPFAAAICG